MSETEWSVELEYRKPHWWRDQPPWKWELLRNFHRVAQGEAESRYGALSNARKRVNKICSLERDLTQPRVVWIEGS